MIAVLDWFDDSGNAALAAVVVSTVAVIVSVVALRKSNKTQRRLLEIEEQREQDRISVTRKARVVARIVREEPSSGRKTTSFYLEIENLGQSPAHDIDVSLDDGPVLKHPTMLQKTEEVRQVGPHSSFRYMLAPHSSARLPQSIKIAWEDDSGEPSHYETTLA
ncbi:MAG: hypothetical protein IID42_07475 [Planctomycetes bacterium]|nr:hypothetical protein [Planctomycetota bacterium]